VLADDVPSPPAPGIRPPAEGALVIIDATAVRSLADLFRREQAVGRCLDPDQAATTAVAHLTALGYRCPAPHQDVPGARPGPAPAMPALPAAGPDDVTAELDLRGLVPMAHAEVPLHRIPPPRR
jgi:hypothetical protein